MLKVETSFERISVYFGGRLVISHSPDEPFVYAGTGRSSPDKNAVLSGERYTGRIALSKAQYDQTRSAIRFSGGQYSLTLHLSETDGDLVLKPQRATTGMNRLWLHFSADHHVPIYGGGSNGGATDLRGRRFPMWVSERVPGRKGKAAAWMSQTVHGRRKFPIPTFFTQNGLYYHFDFEGFGALDFRNPRQYRAELWGLPERIIIGSASGSSAPEFFKRLSRITGRPALLPQWCIEGAWLSVSGGVRSLLDTLERAISAESRITALYISDWSGRGGEDGSSFCDWLWNREMYPKMDMLISELGARGIRIVAHITPHLAIEGQLFAEASMLGYLIKKKQGGNLVTDMGGFMAGHLDLTNPDACTWYKELIKENILKLGFCGYIAGMGDYLPPESVLRKGKASMLHNRWPVMWAKLNREAVREAGRTSDTVFLSECGFGGSGSASMIAINRQTAGWSADHGLPAALNEALALSMSGLGINASETGGTQVFMANRSKELMIRWFEYSAFTPVMLMSGSGGRKDWRFDSDDETLRLFSRMTQVHSQISPYMRACMKENASSGMPVMRPLSIEFPDELGLRKTRDQYMLGPELLCAPVLTRRCAERKVLLPKGNWIHLWSGRSYSGKEHILEAPYGKPPVFYRPDGKYAALFDTVTKQF